ncbi:MAG TPA: aromatic ring-hydroxylating dioxygenase subunit alpha [Alphaproteobacteria bacterium]|nr:aromatic ring-hydroxylating dioxygenase subunit alpha [Alphaproteobacteria bacterium]
MDEETTDPFDEALLARGRIPKSRYLSMAFLELEAHRLWLSVWQMACREEEIPNHGDFVVYDIMDQSVIVVRTGDGIRAFHNVCPHRGRRILDGSGRVSGLSCRFHGWKWDLEGRNREVIDREDWGDTLCEADTALTPVHVGRWGGFVFINMAEDPEPLLEFLDPVPEYLDPFEFEKMRYRWYLSIEVACNWKVAIEAFNEGYHVQTTHHYILKCMDDRSKCIVHGKHGQFGYWEDRIQVGVPSQRLRRETPTDIRAGLVELVRQQARDVQAIYTERDYESAQRLLTEVPASASPFEALAKLFQFNKEAAIASGAGWPAITPEQMVRAGVDWHIFPNLVTLPYADGALWYRALPKAGDPDRCIFEIYSLQRYASGAEPPLARRHFRDWHDFADMPPFLIDDFENMPNVQRGMHSRGFVASQPNPLQEMTVLNFHRALDEYLNP